VHKQAYESPAIVELGTLHERTLSWMVGGGSGFGGYLSKQNASVRKFGYFTIMGGDDDDSDQPSQSDVKSSGSKSRHGRDSFDGGGGGDSGGRGGGGGGRHGGGSSRHNGFNVSDAFKGFGGSH